MSDEQKFDDSALHAGIEKKAEIARKKDEVLEKELAVKTRRLDVELAKIHERDKEAEIADTIDFSKVSLEEIQKIQKDNEEYILAARNRIRFMNEDFDKVIPFFQKNLILIGSETGFGKSTTAANIISQTLSMKDKRNGKKARMLVITNEERPEDVFNRVSCLKLKRAYTEHDKFTDEDIATFNKVIDVLAREGRLVVVHDTFGGARGVTTTVEGICQIFDNLIKNEEYFDAVLIDYYQNVNESRKNLSLNEWQVQALLASKLDLYKNIYPAPIVVFAQLKPSEGEHPAPFKTRIEGRKAIMNVATCVVEIVPRREDLMTEWRIHKNRFCGESVGGSISTGYLNGQYVRVADPDYVAKIAKMKEVRDIAEADRAAGLDVPKNEDE